jgi:hypothetical protein
MLAWLYAGAPAVSAEWRLLHASLQVFGFFGTLIVGVAHHLFARFTGRATARSALTHSLFAFLLAALALRVAGTWGGAPAVVLAGASLQALAFAAFAAWVWRFLDPPPLEPLRRHLTASSGWIAAACLCETFLRSRAVKAGLAVPPLDSMRAVHSMALLGGVIGWVSGVLLRAGPMFAPRWSVPAALARSLPWLYGLGAALAAAGEWFGDGRAARLGELVVLGALAAMLIAGGALRRAGGMLPMVARSAEESRIFRLAVASLGAAVVGAAAGVAIAFGGLETPLLTDAVRHLVAVGFLTAVAVAMTFRLIPVLEGRALPWPRLRAVALWTLASGVVLRTAETLLGFGWGWMAPVVTLSGLFVWAAVLCAGANLVGAIARKPG